MTKIIQTKVLKLIVIRDSSVRLIVDFLHHWIRIKPQLSCKHTTPDIELHSRPLYILLVLLTEGRLRRRGEGRDSRTVSWHVSYGWWYTANDFRYLADVPVF